MSKSKISFWIFGTRSFKYSKVNGRSSDVFSFFLSFKKMTLIYKKRVLYYLYKQISQLTTRNNAGKMDWWKITFPVLKFSESVGGRHQVWTSNDSTHVKVWIVPVWTRFGIWNFSLQFFHNVVKFIQYLWYFVAFVLFHNIWKQFIKNLIILNTTFIILSFTIKIFQQIFSRFLKFFNFFGHWNLIEIWPFKIYKLHLVL